MLYTIGYEGVNAERFVAELKRKGINVLVDVREMPLSRKKGFSKNALAELVSAEGIEYVHLRSLGAPREVRYRLKETGDWAEYCQGYQAHLSDCEAALNEVVTLAGQQDICLMCFEADWRTCHRSLITTHLTETGRVPVVEHLSPQSQIGSAARRAVA